MLKELFDIQEAVEATMASEEVRSLASLIYYQYEGMDDDTMKRALFAYAGRVASVTAFEVMSRLLTEEQMSEANQALDELFEIMESAEEGTDDTHGN